MLITALLAHLCVAPAAGAPDDGATPEATVSVQQNLSSRAKVLILWQSGGSQVKAEAEKALHGSDAEVEAFLNDNLDRLSGLDDRIAVNQILAAGGPAVKSAAQKALDADASALRAFLNTGLSAASNTDLRIRVNQILAAGGPEVKKAAQKALDAGTAEALNEFLRVTSVRAETNDLRIRVNQILSAGGPAVKAAAQTALDRDNVDALRLFIVREWEVAEARDQETAGIAELVASAKVAGRQAAEETQAAKDSAEKALAEADLARQATELAQRAAEAAKDNAAGAAVAAGQAADAANRAASAAVSAIGAANAASAAARIAANAATRAAAAAVKAGRSSSTAWHFAAAARTDRGRAGDASKASIDAADASRNAQQAVQALDLAQTALGKAKEAVDAAGSAGQNATKSADAAKESARWARSAGADASKAEAAAAESRRQADRANRAAASARAYTVEAAAAALVARDLASRAAFDASIAAAAAEEAAAHAGEAENAARLATEHANAASAAAQTTIDAAAQAKRLYDAARKADGERITLLAEQATESARTAAATHDRLGLTRKWNAAQEEQRDTETKQLLQAASAPDADPALVATNGRKVALRLVTVGGSWTKAAAEGALAGTEPEVREYIKAGLARAAALDDRDTIRELIADGSPAKKEAGERALAGTDEDVKRFLASPTYAGQDAEYRIIVNQALAAARQRGDATVAAAAQKALDSQDIAAYRQFLDTGQNIARESDDRIALNQLIANPATGREVRMLSQAVLDGSPDLIRVYRESGQYVAARHDREAAAHQAAVAGMVAEITSVAATASQNAETAQAVAATARNAAAEATDHANRAKGFADDALGHAQRARESAKQAEESARQAAQSAAVAQQAATRASQSSVSATRSAISARGSANIAFRHARSAESAARAAYQAAKDAGADANAAVAAANDARKKAIDRANTEIADARAKFEAEAKKACEAVPAGPDHDDCINRAKRMVADPKGESERNVAICNQFKGHSEEAFNNCLKGAYNPALTYVINKAIADAQDEADTEQFWITAGVIVATVALVAVGLYCAEVCSAPMIAGLAGLEAGFLAEAAGAGLLITIGADLVTGFAAEALLASRVAALSDAALLSGVAVRTGLAQLDLSFIRNGFKNCARTALRATTAAANTELCLIPVQYDRWGNELADKAYRFREAVASMRPIVNVAVAKLPGWVDPVFKDEYVRAYSGKGTPWGNSIHSEDRIFRIVKDANFKLPDGRTLQPSDITDIFTERSPCKKCTELILESAPGANVHYSVTYLGNSDLEAEILYELLDLRAKGGR
ncbi:hypothetical protein [Amycolatopsis sp. cmx-11-32]|uniref:hypothetical protein n=1 Tax=Amycolatopsis sp. cmx-11-32 TaxID=2785796 RepID=UPI0039E27BD0